MTHRLAKTCALVLFAVAAGGGCLFDEVEGIPCQADGECPTTYFCDFTHDTCRLKSATEGIPNLDVPKVRDGSNEIVALNHDVPRVPAAATTPMGLVIVNNGDGPATGIGLTFATIACAHFEVDENTVPETLEKGKSAEVAVSVTTQGGGCASVKIIDWFLSFSGREKRGTFDLDIIAPATTP